MLTACSAGPVAMASGAFITYRSRAATSSLYRLSTKKSSAAAPTVTGQGRSGHACGQLPSRIAPECAAPLMLINVFQNTGV